MVFGSWHRAVAFVSTAWLMGCGADRLITGGSADAGDDEEEESEYPQPTAREPAVCCAASGNSTEACDGEVVRRQPGKPNIMFALDASCSMAFDDGAGWNMLLDAVRPLVIDYDETTRMGITMFPESYYIETDICTGSGGVEVPIADTNAWEIRDELASRIPVGNTPTWTGIRRALRQLRDEDEGERVMIIVTDGVATKDGEKCQPTTIEQEVARAFEDDDITTYVIGLGIELDWVAMDTWAAVGGSGRATPAADVDELRTALDGMVGNAVGCSISLRPPDDYPEQVGVALAIGDMYFDGPLSGPQACGNGFYLSSAEGDEIELCGAACDALMADASAFISYGCRAP